ncbi:MAG: hypothetical protein P3X22_002825 [Thermoprotei archaeon]|nr:hypothetical protein [Thermoprotei archaeon]
MLFLSLALIIDELRRDRKIREEFISEIMPDVIVRLALDRDLRISLLRAIAGEVATKDDLKDLESRLKDYVDKKIDDLKSYVDLRFESVNARIDSLDKRIDDLNRRVDDVSRNVRATLIAILITLLATIIVPLLLRALGLIT